MIGKGKAVIVKSSIAAPLRSGKEFATLLSLIAIAIAGFLAWIGENPSSPKSSPHHFSAIRAVAVLKELLSENAPHPTGSAANAEVEKRISMQLRAIGLMPEQEPAFMCSPVGNCAQISNLLVRIPGREPGPAVLLDAHYDSVAAGPGAADNGSGVVILLEIARILKSGPMLRYPVIFLFDDGEEQALLGSQAFIEHSPYVKDVRWVVNLDARGVSGPSMMFETSSDNTGLIRLFAGAVPRPVSNSLMYDLYKKLPSDTDFTNFRAHGMQGFNLAFVGGTPLYHRAGDVPANLSAASVQHQGETALALVRALATNPPASHGKGDAVFFDIFRQIIWWPAAITPYLIAAAFVLLAVAMRRGGRAHCTASSILLGAVAQPLTACGALASGFLLLWLLMPGDMLPPRFPAHPFAYAVAFGSIGFVVSSLVIAWVSRRAGVWGFLFGNWMVWIVTALIVYIVLPGASYLFVVPAAGAAISLILLSARDLDKPYGMEIAITIPAMVATAIWLPLLRVLYEGIGKVAFPLVTFFFATLLILIFPLLWDRERFAAKTAMAMSVLATLAAIVTLFIPRYSERSPFPLNLQYVQSRDGGEPHWDFASSLHQTSIQPLFRAAPFAAQADPKLLLPWASQGYPLYAAAAPRLGLEMPRMEILGEDHKDGDLFVHARLFSPRNADKVVLLFPPQTEVVSMQIEGQMIPRIPKDYLQLFSGWQRYASTLMPGGLDVEFALNDRVSNDFYLVDESYRLPAEGKFLLNARPKNASASQDGDTTVLYQHTQLGGSIPSVMDPDRPKQP
jgi:hypothetical protein